jgi:hypothetical protein
LGCGKLPAAYCDSKTFYYENACGHPSGPPPPPPIELKLEKCAVGNAAQRWAMIPATDMTDPQAGFIVNNATTTSYCVDVGGCSKAVEKTPVHTFSVRESMEQPSACKNANLRFAVAKGAALVNGYSGLCLQAAGEALTQGACGAGVPGQSWALGGGVVKSMDGMCVTLGSKQGGQ